MSLVRYHELKRICTLDTHGLLSDLAARNGAHVESGMNSEYLYIDNGSNILGVAHLDTVLDYGSKYPNRDYLNVSYKELLLVGHKAHFQAGCPTLLSKSRAVRCITLDDRLGVYVLTNLLPSMGIKVDWLFTVDEEIGQSTARDFIPSKRYNWIFSFDRRGFDPVLYQYHSAELVQKLAAHGMNVTHGSYSDIADVNADCMGINFGVGYDNEHTSKCIVSMDSLRVSLKHFKSFYLAYKDVYMPYVYTPRYSSWMDDESNSTIDWDSALLSSIDLTGVSCELCDSPAEIDASSKDMPGYYLCKTCYQDTYSRISAAVSKSIVWNYTTCSMCGRYCVTDWDKHLGCFVCKDCHRDLYG